MTHRSTCPSNPNRSLQPCPRVARNPLALTVIALLLASGTAIPGCGSDSDAPAKAIRQASDTLQAMTAGGQAMGSDAARKRQQLTKILADIKPFADAGIAGQSVAANLIASRALISIADLDAITAGEHERASLNKVLELRGALEIYTSESENAAAKAKFDPSADLKTLADRKAARAAEQAAAETQLATDTAKVNELAAKATALLAQAKAKREESSQIRAAGQGASQSAKLDAVQRAMVVAREADELDKQASYLQAEIAGQRPLLEAQAQRIASLKNEQALVGGAIDELNGRVALAKKQAADATAAAATASASMAKLVNEVEAIRAGDLEQKTSATLSGYQAAASAAKKAQAQADGTDVGSLKIAAAIATQSRGEALMAKAQGARALAHVLSGIKTVQPPVTDQAALGAKADQWTAQVETLLKDAQEAFGEAKSAYESAGGSKNAAVKDRLDRVVAVLGWIQAGDASAPIPSAGDSAAGKSSEPSAPAEDPKVIGVRATIGEMIAALKARDAAKYDALWHGHTPEETEFIKAVNALAFGSLKFDAACREKFGKSASELGLTGGPAAGGAAAPDMSAILSLKPEEFDVNVRSETSASASPAAKPELATELENIGGSWKLVLNEATKTALPQLKGQMGLFKGLGELMDALSEEVSAGRITTPEQLKAMSESRMQSLIQKSLGGGR